MGTEKRIATAKYIAHMTREMHRMATRDEMDVLAYMLAMAADCAEEATHRLEKTAKGPG